MARYFFHVEDGTFNVDDEGTECADAAALRVQALAAAGVVLKGSGRHYPIGFKWQVHVTDEAMGTVFKLRLSMEEAAPIAPAKLSTVSKVAA